MKTISYNVKPVQMAVPQTLTATLKSSIVDSNGWDVSAFLISMGVPGGTLDTNNKIVPSLQVSDTTNDADFTAAASTDFLFGPSAIDANSKANQIQRIEYTGTKRYRRLVLTVTGAVSVPVCLIGLLGGPQKIVAGAPENGIAAT